jgi:hypothetical protein
MPMPIIEHDAQHVPYADPIAVDRAAAGCLICPAIMPISQCVKVVLLLLLLLLLLPLSCCYYHYLLLVVGYNLVPITCRSSRAG